MTKKIALGEGKFALVDDEDHWFLIQWEWNYSSIGYAVRGERIDGKYKTIRMHRVVLERKLGHSDFEIAEHINRSGIDNHRENLRPSTNAQNCRNRGKNKNNTSGYKGVYRDENAGKWRAQICVDRKKIHLGLFNIEIEAARAYDRAAIEYHGEFAVLNFPRTNYK